MSEIEGLKKKCPRCGRELPWTIKFFYRRRNIGKDAGKNGLSYRCKECDKRYAKEWYRKNYDKFKARKREESVRIKMEVLEAYGGARCVRCGFTDIRALQIDHIEGGGRIHRDSYKPGSSFYRMLKQEGFPHKDKLQVLCANCNWIKRAEMYEEMVNGAN